MVVVMLTSRRIRGRASWSVDEFRVGKLCVGWKLAVLGGIWRSKRQSRPGKLLNRLVDLEYVPDIPNLTSSPQQKILYLLGVDHPPAKRLVIRQALTKVSSSSSSSSSSNDE